MLPGMQGYPPINYHGNYPDYQVPEQYHGGAPHNQQNNQMGYHNASMPNGVNYRPYPMNMPYPNYPNPGYNNHYPGSQYPMNKPLPPSHSEFHGYSQNQQIGGYNHNPYAQYGQSNLLYNHPPQQSHSDPQTAYFPGFNDNKPGYANAMKNSQSNVVSQYNPLNPPYQYPGEHHNAQRSHYSGYEQYHGGISRGSSLDKASSKASLDKTPPRRGLSQQKAYGSQGTGQLKTFTFSKNVQSNMLEAEKLKEAMEGLEQINNSDVSTMSRKTLDQTGDTGKIILKGGGGRSTIREDSINYAVKRLQRKEYNTKKPSRHIKKMDEKGKEKAEEKEEEVQEEEQMKEIITGDTKLVANTGLMHLLVES